LNSMINNAYKKKKIYECKFVNTPISKLAIINFKKND